MHQHRQDTGFQHHVRACNNAVLPGERIPFRVGEQDVGWVPVRIADAMEGMPAVQCAADRVTLADPAALPGIARALSERGLRVRPEP